MNEKILKSGDEVVKDFIKSLEKDVSLDKAVVDAISSLYAQKKLTSIRLQKILDTKKKGGNRGSNLHC
jgi:hypothetical protein